jgi:hypothetical protein
VVDRTNAACQFGGPNVPGREENIVQAEDPSATTAAAPVSAMRVLLIRSLASTAIRRISASAPWPSNRGAVITPRGLSSLSTAISGLRSRAIKAATSMMVSSAFAAGTSNRRPGITSRTVLPSNFSAARCATDSSSTPASDGSS